MRRVFAIFLGSLVLALSIASLGTIETKASPAQIVSGESQQLIGTDQAAEFFRGCSPYKRCAIGQLGVASSIGDSGRIGLSFSFETAKNSHGKDLWVNFKVPSGMTCDFTNVKGYSDTVSGTTIKKAVDLNCYWYVLEELPGGGIGG